LRKKVRLSIPQAFLTYRPQLSGLRNLLDNRAMQLWTTSSRATALLSAAIVLIVLGLLGSALWLSRDYDSRKIQANLQVQTDLEATAIRSRIREAEASLELIAIELRLNKAEFSLDAAAQEIFKQAPALIRIEVRQVDERGGSQETRPAIQSSMPTSSLPIMLPRRQLSESHAAMQAAIAADRVQYSRPYYVQLPPDKGIEVFDVAVPLGNRLVMMGTYSAPLVLREYVSSEFQRSNQVLLVETDGTFIARLSSGPTPLGVYTGKAGFAMAGLALVLKANSPLAEPALTPNLINSMLMFLGLSLGACGAMLWKINRGRTTAETALANQYAFRAAMENSLVTGLRARDLQGRVTYVNPAFCQMVGYSAIELIGQKPPMSYWAPEVREDYERRYAEVLAGTVSREAYETTFMRSNGERFIALIFEAPLIDQSGNQSGWMSSILDVSVQRRAEETNRLQQETIAANSRLAMLGEVATALSHELNQPLAAITSYATAAENLIASNAGDPSVSIALEKIRSQAERAGKVIKSVHDFVRYRSVEKSNVNLAELMQRLEPMIKLQAKNSGADVIWKCAKKMEVAGDGILLEQVILNLTRNAAEAMALHQSKSTKHARAERLVDILIGPSPGDTAQSAVSNAKQKIAISVMDRGPGVSEQIQEHLFDAFRSNKPAGMGIGLSFCRSVVEQLGGAISYAPRAGGGSCFTVTLPMITTKAQHA
jgi:two-component system, LuxR family, sensor histidine kinase DctS